MELLRTVLISIIFFFGLKIDTLKLITKSIQKKYQEKKIYNY